MRVLPLAVLIVALLAGPAAAGLERAASVARAQAMGAAYVSLADDVSSIFVNPAGLALAGRFAAEVEYAEPPVPPNRRPRLEQALHAAIGGSKGKNAFGLGCYVDWGDRDGLLIAGGIARTLFEAGGTSFVSVGANVVLGAAFAEGIACPAFEPGPCPVGEPDGGAVSGDVGIIARPLPVISFGYSAANVFNAHDENRLGEETWHRVQRWGASYFWENRLVVSFAGETMEGETVYRYGLRLKTAVPVELMAGMSNGGATGGVAWNGSRFQAVAAFSSDEHGLVTYTGALELRLPGGAGGEGR